MMGIVKRKEAGNGDLSKSSNKHPKDSGRTLCLFYFQPPLEHANSWQVSTAGLFISDKVDGLAKRGGISIKSGKNLPRGDYHLEDELYGSVVIYHLIISKLACGRLYINRWDALSATPFREGPNQALLGHSTGYILNVH